MANFTQVEILLLLKLLLAHSLTDFALQPTKWVDERARRKYKSKYLYIHVLLTGAVVLLLTQNMGLTLWIAITHFLVDFWKSYQKQTFIYFLLDQLLHLLMLGIGWLIVVEGEINPNVILMNYKYMIYLTGYFIATYPLSIVIKICTAKWGIGQESQIKALTKPAIAPTPHSDEPVAQEVERWNELKEAGRWIGMIERVLIISFVLLDQYEAIGLLIAGKSIIRFKETDQRKSEYFLFGTLLSISLSIFLALAMKIALGKG